MHSVYFFLLFKPKYLCSFQKWKPSQLQSRGSLVVSHFLFQNNTRTWPLGKHKRCFPSLIGGWQVPSQLRFHVNASSLGTWLTTEYLFPPDVIPWRATAWPLEPLLLGVCFSLPGWSLPSESLNTHHPSVTALRVVSGVLNGSCGPGPTLGHQWEAYFEHEAAMSSYSTTVLFFYVL